MPGNFIDLFASYTIRNDLPDKYGIIQQDLAPCHTSRKMCTYLKKWD